VTATQQLTPGSEEPPSASACFALLTTRPLATVSVAFIVGVALSACVAFPLSLLLALSCLAAALLTALVSRWRWAFAAVVSFALVAGWLWCTVNGIVARNDISRFASDWPIHLRGEVASDPVVGSRFTTFVLEAAGIRRSGSWLSASGKALLHVSSRLDLRQGDRLELVCTLQPPRAATNPGQSAPAEYLARRDVRAEAFLGPKSVVRLERTSGRSPYALAARWRDVMFPALERTMPGDDPRLYARLLASIVYGKQIAPLPQDITEAFRKSGTIHVLVVSGSQVTILVASLLLLTRARRGRLRWAHLLLALPLLALFALLVGLGPSIRRAVSMCLLLLAGGVARRDYDAYTALAVAGLIVLLLDPQAIRDVGAQLSFAAAFGVIHFYPQRRAAGLGFWRRLALLTLVGSIGAWAMTLPILAHSFHGFPLLGLLANLMVVPLAALLIPTGLVASLAALTIPPLAAFINVFNRWLIDVMLGTAHFFSGLPGSYVDRVDLSFAGGVAWYVAVLGLLGLARARWADRAWRHKLALGLLVVVAAALSWYALTLPAPNLTITMLDMGDGECLVIRSPTGNTMLVDGGRAAAGARGPTAGSDVILSYLLLQRIRRIDCLVVTHPHEDHINGLAAVVRQMPVGMVLDPGLASDSQAALDLWQAVQAAGVPRKLARRGQRLHLGGGVEAALLAPREPLLRGTAEDLNNNSVVLKLVYGQFSALLTGDIESEGEASLLASGANVRATLLKVAHHGSEASSTPAFLRAVAPQLAFISAGGSQRLHNPSPEVLARLKEVGAEVHRTDTEGAISLTTDGERWSVKVFRPARRAQRAIQGEGRELAAGRVGRARPPRGAASPGKEGKRRQTGILVTQLGTLKGGLQNAHSAAP